jgi:hypothetical protein
MQKALPISCLLVAVMVSAAFGQADPVPVETPSVSDLRNAGIPDWAAPTVADMFVAKKTPRLDPQAKQPIAEDQLNALDADIDALTMVFTRLRDPAASLTLLERWYQYQNKPTSLRTPAAALLKAQAYWLRSHQWFDPPPGRVVTATQSREDLFTEANKDLASAVGAIEEGLQALDSWRKKPGLPSPRVEADIPKLSEGTTDLWKSFPAFRALEFEISYRELQATLRREQGDLLYRELGSVTAARPADIGQMTSLAFYSQARDGLYLARMLDFGNRNLQSEAHQLMQRISWIRAGRAFGGIDFHDFEPYDTSTYVTNSLVDLNTKIDQLNKLSVDDATRTSQQLAWIENLKQHNADRQLIANAFKAQANRELTAQILDLRNKIVKVHSGDALQAVQRAESTLQTFLLTSQNDLSQTQYTGTLQRIRLQLESDILTMVHNLQRHAGPLSSLTFPADIQKQLEGDLAILKPFIASLPGTAAADRSWSLWNAGQTQQSLPGSLRSRIDILKQRWDMARSEQERREDFVAIYKLKASLVANQQDMTRLTTLEADADTKLADLWDRFREKKKGQVQDIEAQTLRDLVIPKLREQVSTLNQNLQRAKEIVRQFQERLAQLRRMIEDIKALQSRVEQTYEVVTGVIRTAKQIPVTIAAGMTTGTMIDVGSAVAASAEAVLNQVNGLLSGKLNEEQLFKSITAAETSLDGFLEKAEKVESELTQKQADLVKQQRIDAVNAQYEPGGTVYSQFKSQEAELQQRRDALTNQIAQKSAILTGIQGQLDAAEQQNLENLARQAAASAQIAFGELQQGYLESVQRVQALKAMHDRHESLLAEINRASELISFFKSGLQQKKDELNQSLVAKRKTSDEEKRLVNDLEARVAVLTTQLQELDNPRNSRMLTVDLLESLGPALALAELNPKPEQQQRLIDESNQCLLRAGRWIYILTGDPTAEGLANPCRSLRELELARDDLTRAWAAVKRSYAAARPKVFVLTFSEQDLKGAVDGRLVFRTRARSIDAPKGEPQNNSLQPIQDSLLGPDARQAVWEYSHPIPIKKTPTFYLTQSAAETDGHGVLTGAWLLCTWKQSPATEVLPQTFPALERQGPLIVRSQGSATILPFALERNGGINARVLSDFQLRADVKDFVMRLNPAAEALLETPFQGQVNRQLFGLGLDNTWIFSVASSEQGESPKPISLTGLKKLQIVFTYLAPTANPGKRPRNLAPKIDLSFLQDGEPASVPAPSSMPPSAPHDEQRKRRLASYRAMLNGTAVPHDVRTADVIINDNLNATLKGAIGESTILTPINVQARLKEAVERLEGVYQELVTQYIQPVKDADKLIANLDVPANRMQSLVEILRVQNRRYEALATHIDALKKVQDFLQGRKLTDAQQEELLRLVDLDWARIVDDGLQDKLNTLKDVELTKAAIRNLIREFREWENKGDQ